MVSTFAISVAIHLGLSVACGIYALVMLFKQKTQIAIENCMSSGTEGITLDTCNRSISIMKGVMIGIYVLTWLIQLCRFYSRSTIKRVLILHSQMPTLSSRDSLISWTRKLRRSTPSLSSRPSSPLPQWRRRTAPSSNIPSQLPAKHKAEMAAITYRATFISTLKS